LSVYEVDLLWRREQLVVVVDGFAFHSSERKFEADRVRDARLAADGFQVIRVTWRQVVKEPVAVVARVAQILARNSARLL
jgi:very-short-patch-repair endonuclease